jgi:hypothetical protein
MPAKEMKSPKLIPGGSFFSFLQRFSLEENTVFPLLPSRKNRWDAQG